MEHERTKEAWNAYRDKELAAVTPILNKLGYALEDKQPHISGERFLMQAITTTHGKKLILLGYRVSDHTRVVIKVTSDQRGAQEIEHERVCRTVLGKIRFSYQVFFSPEELYYGRQREYTISIQKFIEQDCPFLERPVEEQFALALSGFKAQEGAHAATYAHMRIAKRVFGNRDASTYVENYSRFQEMIASSINLSPVMRDLLEDGKQYLREHEETIERYSPFLTHTDFVPHNFRIKDGHIFLLDHSSLVFGNKYEGWARFLNFMTLYNPTLERVLLTYVKDNRTEEESLSLKLMRIYRLGEIIWFYANTLNKVTGDLRTLEEKRIEFWGKVLRAVLSDSPLDNNIRANYIRDRDGLRSEEEKERQVGLH